MEGIVSAAGTLLLVVVILALCYVATRKIGKIQLGMGAGGGKYISILDRQALGQDKAVALVKEAIDFNSIMEKLKDRKK